MLYFCKHQTKNIALVECVGINIKQALNQCVNYKYHIAEGEM